MQRRMLSILLVLTLVVRIANQPGRASEAALPAGVLPRDLGCFMILAGKDATSDGSVLVAHNNDLTGAEASLVEKLEAADHAAECTVSFPSGLSIPQAAHTYAMLVLKIHKGFAEGDAIAINEHQVAIGGGVALGSDRNAKAAAADPLIERGLTGGIRYTALQRSTTARECVEWIGAMYTKHGVTYPSGVAVADPNEIWYMEAGGGHHWAAVRIPDDAVWVQANAYRIGEIDTSDPTNYLASPGLLEFAREHELWDPASGPFHFARAFGKPKLAGDDAGSNLTRVWRGIGLVDTASRFSCTSEDLPLFIVPNEKLTVQRLMTILRDRYDGVTSHIQQATGCAQRPIATNRTVHTDVVQLRSWLPPDIGAVLWLGLSASPSTLYVPFYFGIERVPEPYAIAGATYDRASAFWRFRSVTNLVMPYYDRLIGTIRGATTPFETQLFASQDEIEARALRLHGNDPLEARRDLTEYTVDRAAECLELLGKIEAELQQTLAARAFEW